jgi:hypothetical protein
VTFLKALSKSFGFLEAPTSFPISLKRLWRSASVNLVLGLAGDLRSMNANIAGIGEMKTFTMLLVFLPFPWVGYGMSRYALSFTGLSVLDQVGMSAVAGIVCFGVSIILAWEQMKSDEKKKPK